MIIKSYHRFIINENLQKARSVINRLNIPESNPDFYSYIDISFNISFNVIGFPLSII